MLAHHPDLCAAGVDLYGVADLLELDETTHRFEKHYLHSIVGPLPDAVDRYRSRSPVSVVEQITAPLLILQGDADVGRATGAVTADRRPFAKTSDAQSSCTSTKGKDTAGPAPTP